jgi:HAD superfamily hydrolase (TIGR01509 family)
MKKVTIKAAIFDLDGTLIDFNLNYKAIRGDIREYLLQVNIPSSLISTKDTVFEMLKKTEVFLRNSANAFSKSFSEIRIQVLSIADRYELEAARDTHLLPGVIDTLKTLKNMNFKVGLFTLSGDKSVNYILSRFKISSFFSVTVPRNRVNYVKPNPEHLGTALKVLDVTPQETIVVGDGIVDILTAKELKATAIGLTTGTSTVEQLTRQGADYIITSITDLISLIEEINKK